MRRKKQNMKMKMKMKMKFLSSNYLAVKVAVDFIRVYYRRAFHTTEKKPLYSVRMPPFFSVLYCTYCVYPTLPLRQLASKPRYLPRSVSTGYLFSGTSSSVISRRHSRRHHHRHLDLIERSRAVSLSVDSFYLSSRSPSFPSLPLSQLHPSHPFFVVSFIHSFK